MALDSLAQLQAENDELRERVRRLEALLTDESWLPWVIRRKAGPKDARILAALKAAGAAGLSRDRLIEALYFDDPDGGPERAVPALRVTICVLRKKLARLGITIESNGTGSGYAIYRLSPEMQHRIESLRIAEAA